MIIISSSCRSSSKHMQADAKFEACLTQDLKSKGKRPIPKFSRDYDYDGDKWFDRWMPDGYLDSS